MQVRTPHRLCKPASIHNGGALAWARRQYRRDRGYRQCRVSCCRPAPLCAQHRRCCTHDTPPPPVCPAVTLYFNTPLLPTPICVRVCAYVERGREREEREAKKREERERTKDTQETPGGPRMEHWTRAAAAEAVAPETCGGTFLAHSYTCHSTLTARTRDCMPTHT